jgi:hypothetical protein
MMRSLKKTLPLLLVSLLVSLLPRLLATFCNCIYYSDTRLVPPAAKSEEEERVVENGSLQVSGRMARRGNSTSARSLRGGLYADR